MKKRLNRTGVAGALLAALCLPQLAQGTTLQRLGLDRLVADHDMVVLGEVQDSRSYWNTEGSRILTDVDLRTQQVLKGDSEASELTITLLGGTVGDRTTLILGGARLLPGTSYLLFLNEESLMPSFSALTIREHSQGTFDIVEGEGGELRVVSQASDLLADDTGESRAPGGDEGMLLEEMLDSIQTLTAREVK